MRNTDSCFFGDMRTGGCSCSRRAIRAARQVSRFRRFDSSKSPNSMKHAYTLELADSYNSPSQPRTWPMLILTRKPTESIAIGSDISVVVLGIEGNQVRIGIFFF